MGWFGNSKWDPGNWSGVGDVPIVGDVWKGVFGDPKGVQQAYDKQIQASKDAQANLQNFLMGQKGSSLAYYAPLQHMFTSAYGTEGLKGPQIPQATGGPLTQMYGGSK